MEVCTLYGRLSCGWLRVVCAWSARCNPRYGGKWVWLARCGRCTASSWVQRALRVNWGVGLWTLTRMCSITQTDAIALWITTLQFNPQSAIVACILLILIKQKFFLVS